MLLHLWKAMVHTTHSALSYFLSFVAEAALAPRLTTQHSTHPPSICYLLAWDARDRSNVSPLNSASEPIEMLSIVLLGTAAFTTSPMVA